jgi:hypothetical protein
VLGRVENFISWHINIYTTLCRRFYEGNALNNFDISSFICSKIVNINVNQRDLIGCMIGRISKSLREGQRLYQQHTRRQAREYDKVEPSYNLTQHFSMYSILNESNMCYWGRSSFTNSNIGITLQAFIMAYRLIPLISLFVWTEIIAVFRVLTGILSYTLSLQGYTVPCPKKQFKDTAKPKISPIMSLCSFWTSEEFHMAYLLASDSRGLLIYKVCISLESL